MTTTTRVTTTECVDCGELYEVTPESDPEICPSCEESLNEAQAPDFWDEVDRAYSRLKEGW